MRRFRFFCCPHRSVKTASIKTPFFIGAGNDLGDSRQRHAMAIATTGGPGAAMRTDVVACIRHLRAFAMMLAGDRRRADDLVRNPIEKIFPEVNRPPTRVDLKVQMFAVLHGLHYGAPSPSTEGPAQQRESPLRTEDGLESDELLRIFGRLRDEQREVLILTIASGLSDQQAAEVCGCG